MKNQKGEVVTGVMVLMMVGMLIFGGMTLMHGGGQGGKHGHHMMHGHSEKGQQHAHDGGMDKPAQAAGGEGNEVSAGTK
jgi:hypothetical protein